MRIWLDEQMNQLINQLTNQKVSALTARWAKRTSDCTGYNLFPPDSHCYRFFKHNHHHHMFITKVLISTQTLTLKP